MDTGGIKLTEYPLAQQMTSVTCISEVLGVGSNYGFNSVGLEGITVGATEDSFESIYSATNQWIYSMIFILGNIFFVDEYIHRHTHLRNILLFNWLQVDSRYPTSLRV